MPEERPNVLVIIDDQHRWDYLGYMGADFVETPNIDRVAERGVAFTQCSTTSPICAPARIALATGRMATRTGCLTNSDCLPIDLPNHYRHFRTMAIAWNSWVGTTCRSRVRRAVFMAIGR